VIAADGSYYVRFLTAEGKPGVSKPVVAWGTDGTPLVAGKKGLVAASEYGRVERVFQDDAGVVGAVPGGGWMIHCKDDEGTAWTVPILAWTIHTDGSATALTCDADGVTSDATEGLSSYRIYHPSEKLPKDVRAELDAEFPDPEGDG
jgi:hypothetical protein